MSTNWKSFDNSLSDPEYAKFGKLVYPDGGPISSTAKALMNKGIYDLFPFKIVNLQWLIDTKKAVLGGYQSTNGSFAICFILMTFESSDKYLPLGDMIIRDVDINKAGRQDYTNHWVLLVNNDSSFSTPIPDSNWAYVSRSRGCDGTNVYWTTRSINVPNRTIKSNYKVLGDVIVTGDSEWWWWNTSTTCKGVNGERPRPFAAVHEAFLSVNKNYTKYSPETTIREIRGDYSCRYPQRFNITSPFYTFNITADEDTGGGERDFNAGWPVYMFFDIIPKSLIANCCSNTLPSELSKIGSQVCGDIWKSSSDSCKATMGDYCANDNLTLDSCKMYCKNNDCDNNLEAYCGAGTYSDQTTKYTNQKELCSCFMPISFYQQKDKDYYASMGAAGQKIVDSLKAAGVYGQKPECGDLQCKFGGTTLQHSKFTQGSCPNIQIQNCINEASLNNQGKLSGSLDTSQANNCVQSSSTSNGSPSPSTPPPSGSPSPSTPPPSGSLPSSTPPPSSTPEDDGSFLTKLKNLTTIQKVAIGGGILLFFILILVLALSGDDEPAPYMPYPPQQFPPQQFSPMGYPPQMR